MKNTTRIAIVAAACALLAGCGSLAPTTGGKMGFFITSVGSGKGADLGGLAGADAHCQRLASAAGGAGQWRAYLSVPPVAGAGAAPWTPGTNARDRIGKGPWHNAKGVLIARNVDHLHNGNNLTKETALDEKGNVIKGRGDTPNEHDMLTGSRPDGTAHAPQQDTSCRAWTHGGNDGSAIVGHHDRIGPTTEVWARSWVHSHPSVGCSQEALVRTGGAGRFYCFRAD